MKRAKTVAEGAVRRLLGVEPKRTALTAEEANQQYRDEAAKWEFPAGWPLPDAPFSGKGPDGADAMYGPGMGRQHAEHQWRCAWYRTLLGANSDADRQAAFDQLSKAPGSHHDLAIAAAKAGDLSQLAHFVELNCPAQPDPETGSI
jgi:hypothetical protein